MDLTADELNFLARHGLAVSDVFDGRFLTNQAWKAGARAKGKHLVLTSSRCEKGGHRLRLRAGHCAACNPAALGYQRRHRAKAEVYVAYSPAKRLVKIGLSTDCATRNDKLNTDRIGDTSDWRIILRVSASEGGRLETDAQRLLRSHLVTTSYVKDGRAQASKECFDCTPAKALSAIYEAVEAGGHSLDKDPWISPLFPR